ncbi:endonuclease/exonuclease/phosphatase family protein [bacterium]|nr:endonuclease/exonuclease/phosphatase family protein [bacterium]
MRKFDFPARLGGAIILLSAAFFATVWLLTFHPDELQTETVTSPVDAPLLQPGQKLKILTWNVQFMAGKNYVFWHDTPNFDGPHERPSPDDIAHTLAEVSRVICDENPDIVLLQEVDDGSRRTDHEDQLARLLALLPPEYSSHVSVFYWKAGFVPHPRILGAAGMKLATVSKYRISHARRHQLALPPNDIITRQFSTKRAILEARLPMANGCEFVVLNTHLDAFAAGTNTMHLQVAEIDSILTGLSVNGVAWAVGGDFNLLPPDEAAYHRLPESHKSYYQQNSEIAPLYQNYQVLPNWDDVTGLDYQKWFTHFPNDPAASGPDRTIDYLIFPKQARVDTHYVRQHDTLKISDHLPVIAIMQVPDNLSNEL